MDTRVCCCCGDGHSKIWGRLARIFRTLYIFFSTEMGMLWRQWKSHFPARVWDSRETYLEDGRCDIRDLARSPGVKKSGLELKKVVEA